MSLLGKIDGLLIGVVHVIRLHLTVSQLVNHECEISRLPGLAAARETQLQLIRAQVPCEIQAALVIIGLTGMVTVENVVVAIRGIPSAYEHLLIVIIYGTARHQYEHGCHHKEG